MARLKPNLPWSGWKKEKPTRHERTIMKENCGSRCFLGSEKAFPICTRRTCNINDKGLWAAYIRARQWGSKKKRVKAKNRTQKTFIQIAKHSRMMLRNRGYDVGKTLRETRRRRRKQN